MITLNRPNNDREKRDLYDNTTVYLKSVEDISRHIDYNYDRSKMGTRWEIWSKARRKYTTMTTEVMKTYLGKAVPITIRFRDTYNGVDTFRFTHERHNDILIYDWFIAERPSIDFLTDDDMLL